MKISHPHERRRRAHGAYLAVVLLMGGLTAAFFRVQIVRSAAWELRAESNRVRQLPVPAPRGTLFDRNGSIIADNVPGYAITLLPGPRDSIRATLERLGEYMELPEARIVRLLDFLQRYGKQPLVVDADADFAVVAALEERRTQFPNVYIEMRPKRRYLLREEAGAVLGYVGEITAAELESDAFANDRYEQGMVVGKTGVEAQYESILQGRPGFKYVEVDARGRVVGDFAAFRTDPGEAGHDVRLNLDIDLQRFIHSIFPDSMAGAVVALDPADGGILALYSAPSFDPNAFVGGIDDETWKALRADPGTPLYDRSVLGLYAPASTWKLAAAAIALDLGVVDPDEFMAVPCTGSFYFGRTWRCHLARGHGYNNLAQAIGNSCDVYFYQLGLRVGLDRMLQRANDIGFSKRCGIDLPQESRGAFPADRGFWVDRFGYEPGEGEVLNLAIGQGPNSQTPLKMAQFYLALARDGSAPAPMLAQGMPVGEGWSLNLAPEHLESMRAGLRAVTNPNGTAHLSTALEHWEVLGKTGTGQNPQSVAGLAEDHAWFTGMAGPIGEPPEIVIAVLIEFGASGSRVAAPVMAKAADFYLRKKHGIPMDSLQNYRDFINAGRFPPWYSRRFPPRSPGS